MMLNKDGIIARMMFLKTQNEMRSIAQTEEMSFTRNTDISSMGTGEKAEYIVPSRAW